MYRPLALFLGLRYSRSRRSSGFVSFISASSIIGIALGVMALILGLSAMNGFERELRARVLAVVPHAETEMVRGEIADWRKAQQLLLDTPGMVAVSPIVRLNGLLPGLVDRALARQKPIIERYARHPAPAAGTSGHATSVMTEKER